MRHRGIVAMAILALWSAQASAQPDLARIKADYLATSAKLQKHLVSDGMLLDNDARSPGLLARQWSMAAQWLAASLDAQNNANAQTVKAALMALAPTKKPEFIALDPATFVVATPGNFGNFFIVTRTGGRFRVAWNIADARFGNGTQAQLLAAWQPENARDQLRSKLTAGPLEASVSPLPPDAKGRPRFYLDGTYAMPAGNVVPAQISIWVWDGTKALPLFVERYLVDIGRDNPVRLEGGVLKIRNEHEFKSFSAACDCEVRPFERSVQIAGDGIRDLGDTSLVPELDVVDELFDRILHGRPDGGIAAPAAVTAARAVVQAARKQTPASEWKQSPGLGMLQGSHWDKDTRVLCVDADRSGAYNYRLEQTAGRWIIGGIAKSGKECGNQDVFGRGP